MPAIGIFLTTILISGVKFSKPNSLWVICCFTATSEDLTSAISSPVPCTEYSVPDNLKCSPFSLTNAASLKEISCSNQNSFSCYGAVDGVANSSTAHQWKTTGHHNQGHWLDVVFISRYRVDKVRLKQLNATYKQMKDVQIQFGDLTTVDIQLSIQNKDWQTFRFSARNTYHVRFTANSFYFDDDKAYGFQEIEVYDENCGKDLICEHIEINGSAIVDRTTDLLSYPIFGKFVTIQMRFPETKSSYTVQLNFVEDPPVGSAARSYVVRLNFGNEIKLTISHDSQDQTYKLPYQVKVGVDYTLWIDFSSNKFAFGMGTVWFLNINFAAMAISHVSIEPSAGTNVIVGICSYRGSCQAGAQHHWPMDKLSGGDLLDIKGYRHAQMYGGTLVITGPVVRTGFYTAAVALDSTNNDYIDLGDFAASPLIDPEYWTDGWTFAFWLRFDTLRNLTSIVDGSFISFPGGFYVQPSSVKGLDVSVVSSSLLYRVSSTVLLFERNWYHVTVTWDTVDKLTVYHNVVGKFSSVQESYTGSPSSDSHLHIGCSVDRGFSCDSISVADVIFWNRRLSEEELMKEFQCSGYKLGQLGSVGIGTGLVPNSGLTASSQRTIEAAVYAADLARAGLYSSGPGSWMPSRMDSDPYLQVDLNQWVTVIEVGVQGDPAQEKWVTGYSLSYQQNTSPWTFVPYTTKHSTKGWRRPTCSPRLIIDNEEAVSDGSPTVLEGAVDSSMLITNLLPKTFTTRFLRFHPKSWVGGIAMKVEVFADETDSPENYKGCFNDPGLSREDNYDGDHMTPEICTKICGEKGSRQYALVKAGTQCFCGVELPSVTVDEVIHDALCSIPCPGNPGLPCGGVEHVAVYEVKGTSSSAFKLTTPAKVNVFTNFSFSVSELPEKDYFVDFGNGAALRSSETLMHYAFPSPGKYNVHAWSKTGSYGEPVLVFSASEVEVFVPISASWQCPPAVETSQTFECTLDVLQGSDSNFNVDFYDGKATLTGAIYETLQGVVGDDAYSGELSSSEAGVYLFPEARFSNQGKVQGWEVMARKSGVLRLLIVRPVCLYNTSESYIKSDGSSITASQCTPTECTSSEMLCMASGTCTPTTFTCLEPKYEIQMGSSLASSHEIVHEFIAFVHVGQNLLSFESSQLEDLPTVGPGYEIAFDSPTGIGAEVAMVNDTNRWYFFGGQSAPVGTILDESTGTLNEKGRFHVKAFYFLSSTQVITKSYTNVGVFTPLARFNVDGNDIDFTSTVVVSESIAGANWTVSVAPYLATNATLRVVIEPLTQGYNVTGVLFYEPGDNETFFQERVDAAITYDHVYTRRGMKPLSLTFSNAISSQELDCNIHVQDIVRDLDLVEPIQPTPTGNESKIEWYLLQGSDLTFDFNLGDETFYSNGTFDIDGVLIVYARNIYPFAGEYDVNITVYNDVSNLTLMALAVVEDAIFNLTVEVIHSARDIEVNETISFDISLENGTNPMYSVDFGDGSTVVGRDGLIEHAYSYWQVFEVNITVWNNVSQANITQEVVVHKPVRPLINFTVTSFPTNLSDPVAFMLNISDGTDFNCTWDFGDGNLGESDYDDLGTNVYHTYSAVGVYDVFINCTNRLYATNHSALAIVQLPIAGFVFVEPPPFRYDENPSFEWSIVQGTNATYNLTFGNIMSGERVIFQNPDFTLSSDRKSARFHYLNLNMPHIPGVYEVTIAVWNLVTPPQYITREITFDKPINSALLTSAQTFWEVNKTVTVTTTMSLGTNVTLFFNFGDDKTVEEFYTGDFPTNGANTTHVFETDGDFVVELLVSNPVSNVSLSILLGLQYVPDLGLTSNSPQVHPPAAVSFTLFVNPGKEEPTDANSTWYFGDGTSLTKPFAYYEAHTYGEPGWYVVTVTVFNEVNTANITGYADVQKVIVNPAVRAVNTAGDKGDGAPGAGTAEDIFPQDYPVRFMTNVEDGTNVTYTFDFGDGKVESTNLTYIEHQFSTPGQYFINVIVNNSVSERIITTEITAQAVVKDITVTNDAPVVIGNLMTFNVEIGQLGNQSCFYFNLQNGTKITFKPERTTACLKAFSTDVRSFTGNSFSFTHEYKYITEYIVTFEGQNEASLVVGDVRAVVVGKPCFFPKAVVIEVGENVTTARKFIKSKDIVVPTENVIDCEAAVYSRFEWKVYKYEPDKPHIPKGQNETTFFYEMSNVTGITYDAPRLVVKPRALDYGIYKGVENVSMVGVTGIWDDDDGFFEVVKSPLVATIVGGSSRSVGFSKNFTLDADPSGDPDVDVGNREGIQVYWLCKRSSDNYTFPDDPQNLTALPMIPLLLQSNGSNMTDQGGCFGNGPGLLNFIDYKMKLFSGYLLINETYNFRFFIRKAERSAFYDSSVQVVQGDPPEMAISCQQNCLDKFNPSEKITVLAVCSSCNSFSRHLLLYRWTLEVKEAEEWLSVDLASIAKSTLDRDTLVIAGGTLEGGKLYRIRVESWFPNGVSGFSELAKTVNVPPSGGSCDATPKEGYALKKIFKVQCTGWTDTETPLRYNIQYRNGVDGLVSGIYEGQDNVRSNMSLPLGKEADNYTVFIFVNIMDNFGAYTTVETTVKVTEEKMSDEAFGALMDDMTSDSGALGNLIAEGNAQAMVQLVGALTSLMNSKAATTETEEVTAEPVVVEEGSPKSPEELARLEEERLQREAEKRRKEEEARRKRIEAREKMVNAMASVQVDSINTVQQTSSALQSLLATPEEVSPTAQTAGSAAMEKMADFMLSNAGASSGSTIESAATGLVSGLGYMISASSATLANSDNETSTGAPVNKTARVAQAKSVVAALVAATDKTFQALASQTSVGEDPTEINTPAMSLSAVKKLPSEVAGSGLNVGSGKFGLPMTSTGNATDDSPVDMKGVGSKDNAFSWDDSANSVQTEVMTLELRNATGHVIPVKNLSEPVSIFASTGQTPGKPTTVEVQYKEMIFHSLTVDKNDTSIHFEVIPVDPNTELIVFLKRGARPTKTDYDYQQVIPDDSAENNTYPKDRHLFFISNADTNRTTAGKWYLGVYYNGTLEPEYKMVEGSQKMEIFFPPLVNYTLLMYASGCLFWDEENDKWSGDGCVVGPQSKMDLVQCLCTHLTSFAGDFFVMPNAIDWSAISLDNLFSNPTVFAVVMAIFGVYVMGMVWCRKKDKQDLQQIGTTPLPDNDPRDTYLYELVFFTGHSAGAGTTANVYVILEGTVDETSPRPMKDPVRTKFLKSAVDTFLLAVPSSLGRLKNLRVWHDNAGHSPSWFLQRVLVQDLQTDKKTWFLCDKWLAVEEEDGLIERNLVPATRDDLTSFNLLFSTEARKSLTDNHLWFSVVKRPPRSTFTRCQRLSCCLSVILTTMLANAMFFQTDSSSSTGTELRLGPISFSVKQLSIAITSSLVVLPANILIVTLFRKAGPKQNKNPSDPNQKAQKYAAEEENKQADEKRKEDVIKVEDEVEEDESNKKRKKKSGKLPHWVIYIAYAVVAVASLVSATFTVFYGLTFGVEKSQKWIMTMMISFWQDVLVSQPLKVFAAATFFALVIKNPDKVAEEEDDKKKDGGEIKSDEELVHKEKDKNDKEEIDDIKKLALMPKQPDQVKLEEMRRFKLKQKLMYRIIKEILSYIIFVMILLTVAYGNRDYRSHHVNNALTSYFMGGTYSGKMTIDDISDINEFYKYLRNSLLPTLKPDFWYGPFDDPVSKVTTDKGDIYALSSPGPNGTKVYSRVYPYPKGYTADRANAWLVGIPRIRQLRVIDEGCVFPKGVNHLVGRCSLPYSYNNEDEGYYEPGWIPMNESKVEELKDDDWFKSPWAYKTAWQLQGTPYWGYFHTYWAGGYVAELSDSYEEAINQSLELEQLNWLDSKTRAVFFEFTVYNPFTNFFAVVNILVEILATGGYYPYPYIATTRLYRYIGAEAMVIMGLEVVFFAYLLYYIVREVKELRNVGRSAYFRDPWNYFDIVVIICSILTIVFYFMRMVATNVVIKRANDDPYSFTNFNYIVALDDLVTSFMAFTVFVSFLKFMRLLRFNRRIGMLSSTLKACIKPLSSFFLLFIIIFLAYSQFAFLIFGPKMSDYSSFHRCLANMLGMTLGSFDFNALESTNRILGPVFFFSYIMVMVMILMNVFLSIINDTFNEINSDVSKQSSDSDIADFMLNRFVATVKRTGATIQPIYKEPKDRLDQNLQDIEDLSDNIQLAMRSLCLESIRHTSWFKSEDLEETYKKRVLFQLIMLTGENFTESEVCDAIPVLDTVLAKYSSKDLTRIIQNFREKLAREEREDAEAALEEKEKDGEDRDSEDAEDTEDTEEDSKSEKDDQNAMSDGEGGNDIRFDF